MDRTTLISKVTEAFDLGVVEAKEKKARAHSDQPAEQASYDSSYNWVTETGLDATLLRPAVIQAAGEGWDDALEAKPKTRIDLSTGAYMPWQGTPLANLNGPSLLADIGRVYSGAYDLQKSSVTTNKYLLWGGVAAGVLALLGIGYLAGKPSENPARGPKLLSARKNPASRFVVELDNQGDNGVVAAVSGPGAAKWAKKDNQSIGGVNWESTDDDYAYAVLEDSPDLVKELEAEGYELDTDKYSPPDEHEEAEEEEEERGRTRYTSHGSYPYFYISPKNEAHCYKCATKEDKAEVNYEDPDLYCDECEERIESAYAEDEVGKGGEKENPARGLKSTQDTPAVEKLVRRAANIHFGREKKNEQRFFNFEHGQWFVSISPDPEEPSDLNSEANYSVNDSSPGCGNTGLSFERL